MYALDGLADQNIVGSRSGPGADAEHGVKGSMACAAPVETEHELIEVVLQVGFPQPVVDTQAPALEVGKQPMDPWQRNGRRHRADGDGVVPDSRDVLVEGQSSVTSRVCEATTSSTKV